MGCGNTYFLVIESRELPRIPTRQARAPFALSPSLLFLSCPSPTKGRRCAARVHARPIIIICRARFVNQSPYLIGCHAVIESRFRSAGSEPTSRRPIPRLDRILHRGGRGGRLEEDGFNLPDRQSEYARDERGRFQRRFSLPVAYRRAIGNALADGAPGRRREYAPRGERGERGGGGGGGEKAGRVRARRRER